MNYERSKKLIGSLALMFVFALCMVTTNVTPAFAQDRQETIYDSSQQNQQVSYDSYCCNNGQSACRVVYREVRQAPVCCTRVMISGGYNPYGYYPYGYNSYGYRERKVRSVPW